MTPRKTTPRKKIAIAYMVKGLIAQFTMRVRMTGFPLFPARITSVKSILTMMGYIMKKRQIAMGMEMTGAPLTLMAKPSRPWRSQAQPCQGGSLQGCIG
jgi:hypothetical protein